MKNVYKHMNKHIIARVHQSLKESIHVTNAFPCKTLLLIYYAYLYIFKPGMVQAIPGLLILNDYEKVSFRTEYTYHT
jgi:hypothetical protein